MVEIEWPEEGAATFVYLCVQLAQSETIANLCVLKPRVRWRSCGLEVLLRVPRGREARVARADGRSVLRQTARAEGGEGSRVSGPRALDGRSCGAAMLSRCRGARSRWIGDAVGVMCGVKDSLRSMSRSPRGHGGWGIKQIACRSWPL